MVLFCGGVFAVLSSSVFMFLRKGELIALLQCCSYCCVVVCVTCLFLMVSC